MQDYLSDPQEQYQTIQKRLKDLRTLVQYNHAPAREKEMRKEILKLEKQLQNLSAVMTVTPDDHWDDPETDFPFLVKAEETLESYGQGSSCSDDEVADVQNYLTYFEREFLPLLSKRQLKLDFNYSLVRDSFYDQFLQVARIVTEHCDELDRWADAPARKNQETYFKQQQFKRKHQALVKIDEFFAKVQAFCDDLLSDIDAGGTSCLNSEHILEFSAYDRTQAINFIPVAEALAKLRAFALEVQTYLNLPDF